MGYQTLEVERRDGNSFVVLTKHTATAAEGTG